MKKIGCLTAQKDNFTHKATSSLAIKLVTCMTAKFSVLLDKCYYLALKTVLFVYNIFFDTVLQKNENNRVFYCAKRQFCAQGNVLFGEKVGGMHDC